MSLHYYTIVLVPLLDQGKVYTVMGVADIMTFCNYLCVVYDVAFWNNQKQSTEWHNQVHLQD